MHLRMGRTLEPGQRIDVYRDLNRDGWALRDPQSGDMLGYEADTIKLVNARFLIDPTGREQSLRTGIYTVHAWIEGDYSPDIPETDPLEPVSYNPRDPFPYFRTAQNTRIDAARLVIMRYPRVDADRTDG